MKRTTFLSTLLVFGLLAAAGTARAEVLAPPPSEDMPPPDDVMPEPEPAPMPYMVEPAPEPAPAPYVAPAPAPAPAPHAAAAAPAATHTAAPAPSAEPEEDEDEDDSEWFWIEASAGYSWINLLKLDGDNFTDEPDLLTGSGFIFEGGAGISVSILQIGMTASYAQYENFDIVTAELDLTVVIPIPIIEPFIRVGVGYAHMGNVEVAMMGATPQKARIRGMGVDLGAGLDLHISDAFQLGFAFDASFLNLKRQKATEIGTIADVDFTQDGNSVGLQLNGTVRLTFQF